MIALGSYNVDVSEAADASRLRAFALLQRFGREATSFQILEPGLCYWFSEQAVVAYADTGSAWVSSGEPICAASQLPEVVAQFVRAARDSGKNVRWFHVSETFLRVTALSSTHVGELPIWDPSGWEETLRSSKSLREQLRRARAKGVLARLADSAEMSCESSPLRVQCDALIGRWLGGRGMGELKFMVRLHPYGFASERRYAVAEQGDQVVGLAVAIPIYARSGWFVEDLLRDPRAPNGTAELLVDRLMRAFAAEGSHYATLGLAPLAGEVGPLLALTRHYTTRLYNFPGVQSFKEKLKPSHWEPVYVAYARGELGVVAMRDVLSAFAPAGLVRFGLETLVHQRTLATFLLALLLVPWTLALAMADTASWFPSRAVQLGWAAFDVVLIVLLFSLVRRWRARVAAAVGLLTAADALLTTTQVLFWNVWTARSVGAWLLVSLGCAGPLLAATFFWSTRRVAMGGRRTLTRAPRRGLSPARALDSGSSDL
jgi:phosphatidylglycerol lysyltransferase